MSSALSFRSLVSDAQHGRIITAAAIGNLLEWYNFFAYGLLAITMSKLFFPAESEIVSLLLALATYGGGVVIRPIGAIVLGLYADRVGRKASLFLAMGIMGVGSGLIAVAPTYAAIGPAAPLLILFARILQGFSGAGEFGSATALLAENAPIRWRGLYSSLNDVGAQIGFLLAALVIMIITVTMTTTQIEAGGWRLPFLVGLAIVPVAVYIRRKLPEPDVPGLRVQSAKPAADPSRNSRLVFVAFGLLTLNVVAGNVLFVYMPTYAVRDLGIPASSALLSTVFATALMVMGTLIAAMASDRFGRKPVFVAGIAGYLLLTYPGFVVITTWPSVTSLVAVQSTFGLVNAVYAGPLRATLAELFRARVRATAVGFANSLTVMVGALSPALAIWLIAATGDSRAPGFIVMVAGLCSGAALLGFESRSRESLA